MTPADVPPYTSTSTSRSGSGRRAAPELRNATTRAANDLVRFMRCPRLPAGVLVREGERLVVGELLQRDRPEQVLLCDRLVEGLDDRKRLPGPHQVEPALRLEGELVR